MLTRPKNILNEDPQVLNIRAVTLDLSPNYSKLNLQHMQLNNRSRARQHFLNAQCMIYDMIAR